MKINNLSKRMKIKFWTIPWLKLKPSKLTYNLKKYQRIKLKKNKIQIFLLKKLKNLKQMEKLINLIKNRFKKKIMKFFPRQMIKYKIKNQNLRFSKKIQLQKRKNNKFKKFYKMKINRKLKNLTKFKKKISIKFQELKVKLHKEKHQQYKKIKLYKKIRRLKQLKLKRTRIIQNKIMLIKFK